MSESKISRVHAVTITTRSPIVFKAKAHGTRIEVRQLREVWDKAKTRTLQRAVTSLCSPFHGPDDFKVKLELKPRNDWLQGLLDPTEVRETALYYAKGGMEESKLTLRLRVPSIAADGKQPITTKSE